MVCTPTIYNPTIPPELVCQLCPTTFTRGAAASATLELGGAVLGFCPEHTVAQLEHAPMLFCACGGCDRPLAAPIPSWPGVWELAHAVRVHGLLWDVECEEIPIVAAA